MLISLSACTQNNGNIGMWFGHWKVTAIEIDGTPDETYDENMFFSFQSKVFAQMVKWEHAYDQRFANFEDCGDYLKITFPYVTDENGNPAHDKNGNLITEEHFIPLELSHMSMGDNIVNVDKIDGDNVQLSMVTSNGEKIVYHLKKWN